MFGMLIFIVREELVLARQFEKVRVFDENEQGEEEEEEIPV